MSSYTPKQHTLSESCKQLLELWGRLDRVKEEDVTRFWDSFKEFYKYADKLKVAYKIEPLVDSLTHLQSDVDDAWQCLRQIKMEICWLSRMAFPVGINKTDALDE